MAVADEDVRQLKGSEIDAAAELVAEAFQADPLVTWGLPDGSSRQRVAKRMFAKNIDYAYRYGEVFTAGDVMGVSVWLQPGHTEMTFWQMVRVGLLSTPFRLGWRGFRRMQKYNTAKSRLHDQLMPGPHWYLLILAVAPAAQGKGVGKALMQPVLDRADAQALPCYLETTKQHNLPVFEKFGFETRHHAGVPGGGPPLWAMVREPR